MMRGGFVWLLLGGLLSASEIADSPMGDSLLPLPAQFEALYLGDERPDHYLLDPQNLLHGRSARECREDLDFHAGDSELELYVYLFKGDQALPEVLNGGALAARLFDGGKPAVIVHYFMGRPDRAMLELSPGLSGVVSSADRQRALEIAVRQASMESSADLQLEKFIEHLEIRIYWMEQQYKHHLALKNPAVEGVLGDDSDSSAEEDEVMMAPWLVKLLGVWRAYRLPLLLLLIVIGLRAHRRRKAHYRLLEMESEPRLQAPHAAGVGAVISFADASQSPASQRDGLRRD